MDACKVNMFKRWKGLKYTRIKDQDQYDTYCEILEDLVAKTERPNDDEIYLLSLLISDYNDRVMDHYEFSRSPVELLEDLLQENNLSQIDLAKKVGVSPQLLNDVLKYRREITKNLGYKLSKEFSLKFSTFLKPYKLNKAS